MTRYTMHDYNRICIVTLLLMFVTYTSAFFGWGSSETPTPYPTYYYQRVIPSSYPAYADQPASSIPAIPIQVPLKAQLSQAGQLQNVQLVPCLCPVSPEQDLYNRNQDIFNRNQDVYNRNQDLSNVYLKPLDANPTQTPQN